MKLSRFVSQSFTVAGWVGVTLLLCGPLLAGIGFLEIIRSEKVFALSGVAGNSNLAPYIGAAFIGTFASIGSLPLMLVGRRYRVSDETPGEI